MTTDGFEGRKGHGMHTGSEHISYREKVREEGTELLPTVY